jgi:glycosyltransferase involved in cell wall biosynthesis
MRVALYRAFPDAWRQSMRVYADQLTAHLPEAAGAGDTFVPIGLAGARLTPPGRYWDQYVRYQRLAKRTEAGVHHILDHGFAHLAAAMPANRIVVSFHDATVVRGGQASFGTRRALEIGMRSAVAKGARVMAISQASMRDAIELLGVPESQATVVPLGVDDRFKPSVERGALRERLGLTRPTVLIVGHTQPYMNVEGALQAAARARAAVDLDVVKIGAPLTMAQGSVAQSSALAGHVREMGIVSDAALPDWYAAADALLYLPSLSGFGLPVLEAMASGLPVVASNTGGVAEIAEGAAELADPSNPIAAGDALAGLLTDETRRLALIRHGLAHALRYSWRETARQTLQVYRSVADGA